MEKLSYRFATQKDVSLILFFIKELAEYRGKGYGKGLLQELARIAVERGCGRLEWWCLDWNKPSIDFYLSLGAEPMNDWTVYRITGEILKEMGTREKEDDKQRSIFRIFKR